jgi:hypothetical protein
MRDTLTNENKTSYLVSKSRGTNPNLSVYSYFEISIGLFFDIKENILSDWNSLLRYSKFPPAYM